MGSWWRSPVRTIRVRLDRGGPTVVLGGGVRVSASGAVKSLGVVFFRSGGDGGQGGATVDAVGAVVGLEHVGQALQGGLGQVASFAVLPLLVALAGRIRSGG